MARLRPRRTPVRSSVPRGRRAQPSDDLHQEIVGIMLVATGIWCFLGVLGRGGGPVGDYLGLGLRALVGGAAAWLVPAGLVALGGQMVWLRQGFRWHRRSWGVVLALLALVVAAQYIAYPQPYGLQPAGNDPAAFAGIPYLDNARRGLGGGLVGYALGYVLSVFGTWGRWVAVATAAVIGAVLATGISAATVLAAMGGRLRRAGGAMAAGAAGAASSLRRGAMAAAARPEGVSPDAVGALSPRRGGHGAAARPAAPATPAAPVGGGPARAQSLPRIHVAAGGPGASPSGPGSAPPDPAAAVSPMGEAAVAPAESEQLVDRLLSLLDPAAAATSDAATPAETAGRPAGKGPAARTRDPADGGPALRLKRTGDQWQLGLDTDAVAATPYRLPPLELLRRGQGAAGQSQRDILDRARHLEEVLGTYGVPAKVVEVHQGPTVTRFELTVEAGTKISKVANLADDLAYHLAAPEIRIEAPVPGKRAIGIEVPNTEVVPVLLRDVLESPEFLNSPSKLTVGLGKDIAGKPIIGNLARMPHLLIAGATGSGKSVCLNTIICSLLMKARPDEVRLIMIDPKRVELSVYDGIPLLMAPVCTDPKKAAGYLKWAVREMEARYDLFAAAGVRDIDRYNQWLAEQPDAGEAEGVDEPDLPPWEDAEAADRPAPSAGRPRSQRQPLPYIVIIIDELADLMMVAPMDVEDSICRLAQMARACGMHLVVATQRPSVDVITGLIKANIPSRIAFATSSQVDSRTILDMAGAERLLGKGDMLYHPVGLGKPVRTQGAFISEREVEGLVRFCKQQARPVYQAESLEGELTVRSRPGANGDDRSESAADAALGEAVRVVIEHGQASVSILQRRLRCNYTKAARLIDMMEERGFIGPHQGPKPREVLIGMPQWEQLFGADAGGTTADPEPY